MKLSPRGWQRDFDEPISLSDGRVLRTLHDAATYTTELPKKESALPEWHAAIEALMLVVELGGRTMFARIGVLRALNRGNIREFNPARKDTHSGKRKLARDRSLRPRVRTERIHLPWLESLFLELRANYE